MMLEVVCTFILISNQGTRMKEVVQAPGFAMKTDQDRWLVDISWYINKFPRFKDYNNLVQETDSNDCLVIK
jgi:hypothetical protein